MNALVILPRRNSYAIGKVIIRKRDADGNAVGMSNDKPILDTRKYIVEFDDWEVSELMANVIAESMYAACDDYGNKYLLMESIVGYRKSDNALSVSCKKVVHRGRSFM